MSFTRVAGSTHETRICNHLVPEEECREAPRKQTARGGSHVRPVSCDRAGDARWVTPCPAAVALPDVLRPGLEVTGVSRGPMSFNRHPGSTHMAGICNHHGTRGESMNIANKTVLITGANRGIGRALVSEALVRGAERVYAGVRGGLEIADPRVTPVTLDVTNAAQIARAAQEIESLDVLINNAGIALYDDLSNPAITEQHLAVNLYGPLNVTRAFLPLLGRSQGAVVNNLSVVALAPVPVIPGYSISKAAALNMTQALRALLAGKSVSVHAVFLGPIDTDMNRGFDIPKTPTEVAARGIFDGLERGEEDIFPDPMSQSIAQGWRAGAAKALERQFAAFVPQSAAAA